jgi:hypothetical protein
MRRQQEHDDETTREERVERGHEHETTRYTERSRQQEHNRLGLRDTRGQASTRR